MEADAHESRRRVLVVEDEPSIRELLATFLESTGYDVRTASTGIEAEMLLLRETFDAVVSDIRMPGKTGIELYEAARQRSPDLARRMIMITGDMVTPETSQFLRESGCAWVAKPFDLIDVLGRIRRVTGEETT